MDSTSGYSTTLTTTVASCESGAKLTTDDSTSGADAHVCGVATGAPSHGSEVPAIHVGGCVRSVATRSAMPAHGTIEYEYSGGLGPLGSPARISSAPEKRQVQNLSNARYYRSYRVGCRPDSECDPASGATQTSSPSADYCRVATDSSVPSALAPSLTDRYASCGETPGHTQRCQVWFRNPNGPVESVHLDHFKGGSISKRGLTYSRSFPMTDLTPSKAQDQFVHSHPPTVESFRPSLPAIRVAVPSNTRERQGKDHGGCVASGADFLVDLRYKRTLLPSACEQSISRLPEGGATDEMERAELYGDLQVLVDIDDTVRSSGGITFLSVALGGVDTQYARGQFYPGCFQFLFETALFKCVPPKRPLSLGVLTARIPQVPITDESPVNIMLRKTALRRGIKGWGIDCENKVLYSTLNEWFFPSEKGKRKFENLLLLDAKLSASHPEMKYIWVGDTGEMDRVAGDMMAMQMPEKMRAIFLHFVGDDNRSARPPDYDVKGVPIIFFRTYVKAAKRAVDFGLLDRKGLARVVVQAVHDLEQMKVPSTSTKWRDLIIDIRDAESILMLKRANAAPLVRTREILQRRVADIRRAVVQSRAADIASKASAQQIPAGANSAASASPSIQDPNGMALVCLQSPPSTGSSPPDISSVSSTLPRCDGKVKLTDA